MTAIIGESGYERKELDAYWTPPWCVAALMSQARKVFEGFDILEPCAGEGWISHYLNEIGFKVESCDIKQRTFKLDHVVDFLQMFGASKFAIITNPPFRLADKFIQHALDVTHEAQAPVAMLLRNEFDCAFSRRHLFLDHDAFAMKIVLTRRPKWSEEDKASPRHNFAWYVWDWRGVNVPARITYAP